MKRKEVRSKKNGPSLSKGPKEDGERLTRPFTEYRRTPLPKCLPWNVKNKKTLRRQGRTPSVTEHYPSFRRTASFTVFPSAVFPASFGMTAFMTFPMSFAVDAPVSAIAAVTAASISSAVAAGG